MSYRIRRVDDNQKEIVAVFRRLGASVAITSELGRGFPDLIVGYDNQNVLVEVKDGSKVPSQQKLTSLEQKFFDEWKGKIVIIRSGIEAVHLMLDLGWNETCL